MTFVGLDGVAQAEVDGVFCGTAAQMVSKLGKARVTSAAGDEGSLTAWIDDAGNYRASFDRYMSSRARGEFKTKTELRQFLDRWFPAMRDVQALSKAMKEPA